MNRSKIKRTAQRINKIILRFFSAEFCWIFDVELVEEGSGAWTEDLCNPKWRPGSLLSQE